MASAGAVAAAAALSTDDLKDKVTKITTGWFVVEVKGPVRVGFVRKLTAEELKNDPFKPSGASLTLDGVTFHMATGATNSPSAFRMQNGKSKNVYSVITFHGHSILGCPPNTINVDGQLFDCS